jgi:RNA polymerase sigma-70 factor, ECF subfamily
MFEENEEKNIISGLIQGDARSFDIIFKKYNKRVYYFALSYIKHREEAEDIVQEVFMNLWRFRGQINLDYDFSKYLFKFTYNATCKKFRKQASDKRHIAEVLKSLSIEDDTTRLNLEYNNINEITNKLIEELPDRQKEILLLSVKEQLDTEQIALKLIISKKTVENYLALAKSSIRKSLKNLGLLYVFSIYMFL